MRQENDRLVMVMVMVMLMVMVMVMTAIRLARMMSWQKMNGDEDEGTEGERERLRTDA